MRVQLANVDLRALSEQARAAANDIAIPHSQGTELAEIAEQLDMSVPALRTRLEALAAELDELGGNLLPPLTSEEYASLRASIQEHGQLETIKVAADGEVIDGSSRMRVCRELGIEPRLQVVLPADATDAERRAHGLIYNVARRQLQLTDKRGRVAAALLRDPKRSDRAIAVQVGCSPTFVGKVRADLVSQRQLSTVDSRQGQDGRVRALPARVDDPTAEPREEAIGDVVTGDGTGTPLPPIENDVDVRVPESIAKELAGGWSPPVQIRLVRQGDSYDLQVRRAIHVG